MVTDTFDQSPSEVPTGRTARASTQRITRSLLSCGVLAGPVYVTASLSQALTRDGFDLTRHEWSLLATGPGGWMQVTNLVVTGLLVMAAGVGFWRAGDTSGRLAPQSIVAYGLCLVGGGIFVADPMRGFPVGTPPGPPVDPTLHGTLHLVFGGIGFVCLIAACLMLGRRFARAGMTGYAVYSVVTGASVLVGFVGVASGVSSAGVNLMFTAAIVLSWSWLTVISIYAYARKCSKPGATRVRK